MKGWYIAMKYKITDSDNGFTLIELIIVIVIIAILTGVSVSGYSKYVGQAKVSSDINNANIVLKAMNTALAEEGVYEELLGKTASDKIVICMSNTGTDIQNYNSNLNPSQQSIQKPLSHNEWLEELKRRRKKLGWW